jgi:hypothetical protein
MNLYGVFLRTVGQIDVNKRSKIGWILLGLIDLSTALKNLQRMWEQCMGEWWIWIH